MKIEKAEVCVCVNGRPVQEYVHEGKMFIEGRKSSEFTIKIRNRRANERMLFVPSVDGLSTMTGKEANIRTSGGYVLGPQESVDIPGWMLDDESVAKFIFNKKGKSYATKMGKPTNVGVIGVGVFHEKPQPRSILRSRGNGGMSTGSSSFIGEDSDDSGAVLDCMFSSSSQMSIDPSPDIRQRRISETKKKMVAQDLGTGFGDKSEFKTTTTIFEKASEDPQQVFEIRYDSRQALRKRGIDFEQRPVVAEPNPFPGQGCQPPDGWVG